MTAHANDTGPLIDLAIAGVEPSQLEPEERYAFIVPADGDLRIVDPLPDSALAAPRRVTGTTVVLDVASFAHLFEKYGHEDSETYADLAARTVTTVVNADTDRVDAGHRDHRLVLQSRLSAAWQAWTGIDGKWLPQVEFAEFIEDRLLDIAEPDNAQVLELAQFFQARTRVNFKSANVLSSSTRSLVFEETVDARAGQKGDQEIPAFLLLGLAPFEGGDAFKVRARFRYRIDNGNLSLGVKLERPDDALRTAFDDVRTKVAEQTGYPVLVGTAPPPTARR